MKYEEAIQRCETCAEKWNTPNSLESWFSSLRKWIELGRCERAPDGIDPFLKTLNEPAYRACFEYWLDNEPVGRAFDNDLKFDRDSGEIIGWSQSIGKVRFHDEGAQAVDYLDDLTYMDVEFGIDETYSFHWKFVEMEIYRVLVSETLITVCLALSTVIAVVLFITVNL